MPGLPLPGDVRVLVFKHRGEARLCSRLRIVRLFGRWPGQGAGAGGYECAGAMEADVSGWFKRYRVEWIIQMVQVYGFINRVQVERMFGISTPQASLDIQAAIKARPDLFAYNASAKRYELPAKQEMEGVTGK